MKNRLLSYIRLTREEKIFFGQALLLCIKYRIRLTTTPLNELITLVNEETKQYSHKTVNITLPRTYRLMNIATKLTPFSTCLSNALAGQVLFAANQHPTELHIGVRNTDKKGFEAHAWLTINDTILLGNLPDLATYQEFPPIHKQDLQ